MCMSPPPLPSLPLLLSLLRRSKLILLFYRPWAFASNLVTAVGVMTLARTGVMTLPFVMMFKVAVMVLIWYFMREFGARSRYYFTNLGMTPRALWGWSIALDMTVFAAGVAIAIVCKLS